MMSIQEATIRRAIGRFYKESVPLKAVAEDISEVLGVPFESCYSAVKAYSKGLTSHTAEEERVKKKGYKSTAHYWRIYSVLSNHDSPLALSAKKLKERKEIELMPASELEIIGAETTPKTPQHVERLRDAIKGLTEQERTIIEMYFLREERQTLKQIAKRLNLNISQVTRIREETLQALREYLKSVS